MKNILTMKYPSSWQGEMWREAAPCGNGRIGAGVYGGIQKEIVLLNHARLWRGARTRELPDVSGCLPRLREKLARNDPAGADSVLSDSLHAAGYDADIGMPLPLGDLNIFSYSEDLFANYRRTIDLEKALVTVSWREDAAEYSREYFVSRANDLFFTRIRCRGAKLRLSLSLTHHDAETLGSYRILHEENRVEGDCLYYAAENDSEYSGGDYGAVARVFTDGRLEAQTRIGGYSYEEARRELLVSDAAEVVIVTRLFVGSDRAKEFAPLPGGWDFDAELGRHAALHGEAYRRVDFSIASGPEHCNEELLLDAYDRGAPPELFEKLYAFGRYLFICSTAAADTLPVHLVGLWNGTYNCFWAFYMYNVNYQMMYWQALSGSLPEYLRLALDYTESQVPDFEINAKRLYGCRGIFINAVNTPESGLSKNLCNHILNWTGGAAWASQHFWNYCLYTGDRDYMVRHALPFMARAAAFYEDFLTEGPDGTLCFSPSVSPENTAGNVLASTHREVETCRNATMDIALVHELLTNLLKGARLTGLYAEKVPVWQSMLRRLPPYRVNADGAVQEWTDDFYTDNYNHRHHSHLYPVFPGREVRPGDPLFSSFEKAEELRLEHGLSAQCNWSMVYMACIAARMHRGERACTLLGTMARTCLMDNFFTLSNDWRRSGPVSCLDFRVVPFQMDGNLGFPAAVNEMLLCADETGLEALPALPSAWPKGHITGLSAPGGVTCGIVWDESRASVTLTAPAARTQKVRCFGRELTVRLEPHKAVCQVFER